MKKHIRVYNVKRESLKYWETLWLFVTRQEEDGRRVKRAFTTSPYLSGKWEGLSPASEVKRGECEGQGSRWGGERKRWSPCYRLQGEAGRGHVLPLLHGGRGEVQQNGRGEVQQSERGVVQQSERGERKTEIKGSEEGPEGEVGQREEGNHREQMQQ